MDGYGLNLKKWGLSFHSFNTMPAKVSKKGLADEIFYETLLHNYTTVFFYMGKDVSTELTKTNKILVSCSL